MRVLVAVVLVSALAVPASAGSGASYRQVNAIWPAWSSDGDAIAYTQELPGGRLRAQLVLAPLRDGSRRVLDQVGYAPQWSPLGGLIAYVGRDPSSGNISRLRIADTALLASAPTIVADDVSNFAWSPDGQELYYDEGWLTCGKIRAYGTYSGVRRTVAEGAAPLPSPDGKLLAYVTPLDGTCTGGFGALSVANVDGTGAHVVVDGPVARAAWSPDGKELAVEVRQGDDSLIELADASGPASVLVAHATRPAWSPDGTRLAFLTEPDVGAAFPRDEPYLQIVDMRTRDVGRRLLSASAESGGPVWSPSGDQIALSRALERGGRGEGLSAGLNRSVSLYVVPAGAPAKARRISLAGCELVVPRCTLAGGPGGNVLDGTPGRDVIWGYGGDDRIFGAAGDDDLHGGSGNDILIGGHGHDVIAGGSGNDVIFGRDGTRDSVFCGSGDDTVVADRFDAVARDCERVVRS